MSSILSIGEEARTSRGRKWKKCPFSSDCRWIWPPPNHWQFSALDIKLSPLKGKFYFNSSQNLGTFRHALNAVWLKGHTQCSVIEGTHTPWLSRQLDPTIENWNRAYRYRTSKVQTSWWFNHFCLTILYRECNKIDYSLVFVKINLYVFGCLH